MAKKAERRFQSGHEVFSEFVPSYVDPQIDREESEGLISSAHRKKLVDSLLKEFDEALKTLADARGATANNKRMQRSRK